MTVYCLFEQSGTFKSEFKKLGYKAYDYDILNEFGETDYIIDLFDEIRKGYDGQPSLFDKITPDDLIMAFFPCTRFEARIPLLFRGEAIQQKNWTDVQKLEYAIQLQRELSELYILISQLVVICKRKSLRMVIENPYTQPHYLTTYWPMKPTIIDKDRTENGDYYRKPTQYWFINFEPKYNFIFEPLKYVEKKVIGTVKGTDCTSRKTERSLMHPQYARRFIKQYLIDRKEKE